MRQENFQIGEIKFKWGDTLSDIKSQLSENVLAVENENKYSKNKTLKIQLPGIWSIKTNTCEFSSPESDRLINNISIGISASENKQEQIIQTLENHLGPKSTDHIGDNYGSGSVVKNCTWKYYNCHVGVSIYGGIRQENNEESIGHLYIHLDDINILDSLYTSHLRDIESSLTNKFDLESIESFKMEKKQWITWSMENQKYPDLSPNFISRALNGFHKREIFKTPEQVQNAINEFEVAIWKSTSDAYFLSNYWETIRLTKPINTSWVNALPAKGGGYCTVSIGDLRINNEHSRPETKALINKVEKLLDTEIKCHQDHDC